MVTKTYTDDEFESLMSQYDYKFQKGDLVKGIVCGYDSEGVIVDIGAKTSAVCPDREARVDMTVPVNETLQKGQVYEFLIIREEDEDGKFLLSYKKVALAYAWKELEALKDEDATVEGTVVSVVKGGVLVEVKGVRGFIPSSHLRAKDTENIVGEKIELKILSLDTAQNNFILSNKKGHYLFDLEKFCFDRLEAYGVSSITVSGLDTYALEKEFFSFRRNTHRGLIHAPKCFPVELSCIVL